MLFKINRLPARLLQLLRQPLDNAPNRAAMTPPARRKHGCYGLPRPTAKTSYLARDGYIDTVIEGVITRTTKWKRIYHVMTVTCNYDKATMDNECEGCFKRNDKNPLT